MYTGKQSIIKRRNGRNLQMTRHRQQKSAARKPDKQERKRLHADFELRIAAERTAQLEAVNQKLRDEIAARTQIETALQVSETRYRRLFETAQDGILILDADTGQITDVNPFLSDMLGYAPEEFVGKRLWEIGPFKDIEASRTAYAELQRTGYIRYEHLPLENRAGRRVDVEFVSNVYLVNQRPVIQCNIRDITERKRMENVRAFLAQCGMAPDEDFFQSLARYLAENLRMDYVCIDRLEGDLLTAQTVAIYFDGQFEDNAAYSLHDTPCGDVVSQTVCCFPEKVRQLFPRDVALQEMQAESYVGVTLWDHTGRPIGLIAVIGRQPLANPQQAETLLQFVAGRAAGELERIQAGAELRRATEAADEANRAKSDFLAHMSHELRTPLTGILGYAQILKRDTGLTEAQRAGLDIIERSGNHLLTLITEILDLAKIEARTVELHLTEVILPEFLQEITAMIQVPARQKGITFHCEPAPELPAIIIADAQRLRQVLLNLLNNAVKFTDQGRVTLRVKVKGERQKVQEEERQPEITLHPSPLTFCLSFEVEDTGPGIAAEHIENIFTPFRQVGNARHRGEGAGLGLAISQQLARLMGGVISVTSVPGQGSLFRLTLRLAAGMRASTPQCAVRTIPIGFKGTCKLLIVDDRAENRSVLHDMLRPLGFEIQEAATGQAGIARALTWRPTVILMDVMMPDMNGLDAVTRIREMNTGNSPVIIAVSADVSADTRRNSIEAGCDDFLPKPVQLDDALNILRTHLALDWIYAEKPVHPGMPVAAPPPIIPPPRSLAAELLHFAEIGDVLAIRTQCNELLHQHSYLYPFAAELKRLAQGIQMKEIRTFLAAYTSERLP
ncbi:two-component hybrid sensor and regulator [Candidatus Vecturithrix granuli]|uniref:histidine kinase n=1 Tax=Vecturithrix granuli TaxID=1499967 RepID=A0A081BV99_VECG1|nr:two-component hybrid sensor and regulator [Candidatus Vecturithrix granuli]